MIKLYLNGRVNAQHTDAEEAHCRRLAEESARRFPADHWLLVRFSEGSPDPSKATLFEHQPVVGDRA